MDVTFSIKYCECLEELNDHKLFATNGYFQLNAFIFAAIFWDIAPYSPYVNVRFGRTYHIQLLGRKWAEQQSSV
jgi:hypothetical protein